MKVVVAIDSFKGSLSTFQAGNAIKEGIQKVLCNASVFVCPLADGGEGTMSTLVTSKSGSFCSAYVTGPLGNKVKAEYGIFGSTAVIEVASCSGITLIDKEKRNPLFTTTYGVGEIILDAIEKGYRKFIIGLGGSGTNDGGVGMLQAFGYEFLDNKGNQISFGAIGLSELKEIRNDKVNPKLKECEFIIASDVKNPLCGNNGCSIVYGPQKGASRDMSLTMDKWLENYAKLTNELIKKDFSSYLGSGAAGGLGFAFLAYLNSKIESGIDLIIKETNIEKNIKDADIVITGEGKLDSQTCMGKAPIGIAKLAKKYNKKVIAFSGCVTNEAKLCNEYGIDAFFPIIRNICSLEEALNIENAYINLKDSVEQVFRLINIYN